MSAATLSTVSVIERCRVCAGAPVEPVLELGQMPLANALRSAAELSRREARFPLTLGFCPTCSLVQIFETVDPEVLFRDYVYFSSFSDTMMAHARDEAETLIVRRRLRPESLVVEIASNDGYLLGNFVRRGIGVLGIEPARNVARAAEENGVPTLVEFFGRHVAERLRSQGRAADVILGNNVLAHVADLHGFAEGVERLLAPKGCAVFEFPYVGDMLENVEFDTIYHEHLCYYSLHAVRRLFEMHALAVTDVERLAIHGGSLRLFVEHPGKAPTSAVAALLEEEKQKGLTRAEACRSFAEKVAALKTSLRAELAGRKKAGQKLAAYGASAKGATLLNHFQIGAETLDFIVDRSTAKQGKYAPGTALPILAPEALLARRPDAVLLLTWNFADEIIAQQRAYLEAGGVFLVPVPSVRAVGKEALP